MKKSGGHSSILLIIGALTLLVKVPCYSYMVTNYPDYLGMYIFAQDYQEQYLGKITTNKYDSESIINDYRSYGSKYSSYSAYNSYTSTPPIIYSWNGFSYDGQAYLSRNKCLAGPTVDPDGLIAYLEDDPSIPPISCYTTKIQNKRKRNVNVPRILKVRKGYHLWQKQTR